MFNYCDCESVGTLIVLSMLITGVSQWHRSCQQQMADNIFTEICIDYSDTEDKLATGVSDTTSGGVVDTCG